MEIQQSAPYANYIRSLGWQVITRNRQYYYLKMLPLMGGLLKVQRVTRLPDIKTFLPILRQFRVRRLVIEPDSRITSASLTHWMHRLPKTIFVEKDPYIPTKTIRVDVTADENTIFHRFSEAKRRAVRRAIKNNVRVEVSSDIRSFIQLKNRAAGFLGFITTYGLEKLWHVLAVENKAVLLASANSKNTVAGIFMIFWGGIAYYWVAGATLEGKKMFAPTLLVWEALKVAKKRGCKTLDFVGVWDERQPNKNHEWKGFTKFKEGFGGNVMYYPLLTK